MTKTFRPTNLLFVFWLVAGWLGLAIYAGSSRGKWGMVPVSLGLGGIYWAWWVRQRIVLDGDYLEYRTTFKTRRICLSQVDRMNVSDGYNNKIQMLPLFELHAGPQSIVVNTKMFGPRCHREVISNLPEPFRQEAAQY